MFGKVKKSALIMLVCTLAASLAGAAANFAVAEDKNYYVCFSNQNYSVRNANKMEYSDGEYILGKVSVSSAIDFYVADKTGTRWYAGDNSPMKVEESGELKYNILFSPDNIYPETGCHISYVFYEPNAYSVNIGGIPEDMTYNPYHTAYELYYISSIELSAGTSVSYGSETHTVNHDGFYRILFTPEKTINGNKFMFDEDGNYGSGDDYKYSLYIADAPRYYAVLEGDYTVNTTADAQINGKDAYILARYEKNVAAAEYRFGEIFAPERDFGVKYKIYENAADGAYRLIDDDNNEDTNVSKLTATDAGWYSLSFTDGGDVYLSSLAYEEKDFGGWYVAGEFNGFCYDKNGNIDLSDGYKFSEVEDGDDDYDEDYKQYILYLIVTEKQLRNGDEEFYITDGKTKFKDGTDYINISTAGKYKILCSEEHTYGRGRNFRYILEDENKDGAEITLSKAEEFIEFAENCSKSADYSVNLKVYLSADIDFAGVKFVPVGAFSGTFYGGYHKLKNITYTPSGKSASVFETVTHSGTVERLTAENINLGDKNSDTVGFVGTNYGTVKYVTVTGKVIGKNNVGGVAAINGRSDTQTGDSSDLINRAVIENCSGNAEVAGETFVGGVCGRNTGDVYSCECSGIVLGSKTHSSSAVARIGGIAGYSYGKIYGCNNSGNVVGGDSSQYAGGIVGLCVGEVYFCTNRGEISADKYAGGIVGYYGLRQTDGGALDGIMGGTDGGETEPVGSNNILNYTVNYGSVTATAYVGGVLGNAAGLNANGATSRVLKIYNSVSVGDISATAGSYAGGIAGYAADVDIKSCLSSGTVQAKGLNGGKYVGGTVGYGGDIRYSMSAAMLKGDDYIGGISGYATSAVIGCYTNVLLLGSKDAENVGEIAGYSADYNASKNEFGDTAGNYYVGEYGGICGTEYAVTYGYAAAHIQSGELSSSGTLSPALCVEFSREYWQGGKGVATYPVLRNFETAEECTEFGDDELFEKLFIDNSTQFESLAEDAAKLTFIVTFMEWNKDNGDLYDDGELQTDNFDVISAIRVSGGQTAEIPALIYAEQNGKGEYIYEGGEARYYVSFPKTENVKGNITVYAEYRELVTSISDKDNRVFIEGEFRKGTEVSLVNIGDYYTVEFMLDGRKIEIENFTLKYFVGERAEKFSVYNTDCEKIESVVSGKYISFNLAGGSYFKISERTPSSIPFWAWLLIGIGGSAAVAGITVLTVFLIKRKKSKNTAQPADGQFEQNA